MKLGKTWGQAKISVAVGAVLILAGSAAASPYVDVDALRQQGQDKGWTFAVTDNPATQHPLEALCGLVPPPDWQKQVPQPAGPMLATDDLPTAFDWRDTSPLPPVRNQGGCGSCWAFATVGPLECNIKLFDGYDVNLSEQWLVSCNRSGWGCGGGWWAHSYHLNSTDTCGGSGAVLESDFPYVAYDAACSCPYPHAYFIDDWGYVPASGSIPSVEDLKLALLEHGPLSVAITVNSAFQGYGGGVFNACTTQSVNHGVTLVGWDDSQGTNGVWIIRNSWGRFWGESGYMRIEYGCSKVGYGATWIDYTPAADPPVILSAASVVDHAGEPMPIEMSNGIIREPRMAGLSRLVVTFDQPMDVQTAVPASVDITGVRSAAYSGQISTSLDATGTELTITFAPPLPDQDNFVVDLSGVVSDLGMACEEASFEVVALKGDVNGDGLVSAADAGSPKQYFGMSVHDADPRADLDADGVISTTDSSVVKSRFGHQAP